MDANPTPTAARRRLTALAVALAVAAAVALFVVVGAGTMAVASSAGGRPINQGPESAIGVLDSPKPTKTTASPTASPTLPVTGAQTSGFIVVGAGALLAGLVLLLTWRRLSVRRRLES